MKSDAGDLALAGFALLTCVLCFAAALRAVRNDHVLLAVAFLGVVVVVGVYLMVIAWGKVFR